MKRRFLWTLLTLCLLIAVCVFTVPVGANAQTVVASGTCGRNLTWTLDETGLLTISGTGSMSNSNANSVPWVEYKEQITSVVMNSGITTVGQCAFYECTNLTSVTIPEGVTWIRSNAFYGCSSLASIKIPGSVTHIYEQAFKGCSSLTAITIPDGVTHICGGTFAWCSSLTTITIPKSVTRIDTTAFWDCSSLKAITIPDGVTSIEYGTFNGCSSLTTIKIPKSVTSIGEYAFDGCSSLTAITIPDGVTSIGDYAFRDCSSLTTAKIPKSITSIAEGLFWRCRSLKNVTIPNGVVSIAPSAFSYCSSLSAITIPKSVISIGGSAFSGCSSLTAITILDGVTSIENSAFYDCSSLTAITIPKSVTSMGECAFGFCSKLSKIIFEGNAPELLYYCFWHVNATAYYPAENSTWTEEVMQNYGGSITWVPYETVETPVVKISGNAATGKPKITWDKVEGAVQYKVYRSTSKNGSYSRIYTTTGTTCTNTSAEVGVQYYYYVVAINALGKVSDKSNIVTRTCDLPQPKITSSTNVASSGKPKITWDKVEGATKYKVYRSTSKSSGYSLLYTTTGTSCTNTSAEVGTLYYYKVMAVHSKSAANSAYSSVVSRTCDLPQPKITSSTNVASSGKPKITWSKVDGATKYKVYRSTSKDSGYSLLYTTTGTSCTNTSAEVGTLYYYKVMAVHSKSAANSAYSSVVSRTCDLPQPKITSCTNVASTGKPKITWDKVEGATKYKVYRSTSKDSGYSLLYTTTGTSCTNTSAEVGTLYYYKVMAVHSNSAANSAKSTIVSITCK